MSSHKSQSKSSPSKPRPQPAPKPPKQGSADTRAARTRSSNKASKVQGSAAKPVSPKLAASRVEPNEAAAAGELSTEVMEFINAIDEYKRQRRRPFPNWSEIFEIVKALGYKRSA